ncbi:DUF4123 domain-containing protein [Lysobacter cavernae]|uniref:DUF4123 domain-containing protein n=1 Tax=Lysobacter cavernae TaxID=1685901 RepID=A0ABV7RV97_9GAMM
MKHAVDLDVPLALDDERAAITKALWAAASEAKASLYATLDLAAMDEPQRWLQRLKRRGSARDLFLSQPEGSAETLAVWLVGLRPDGSPMADAITIRSIVDQALQLDCVTWLVSDLALETLAERLSQRLTASTPEGEALFRYYDPRVLPVLHYACDETQRNSFFALGHSWWYLDAYRCLQGIPIVAASSQDTFVAPMPIRAVQAAAMQVVSERHQLVRFLGKRRPMQLVRWSFGQRMAFVEEQDQHAQAEGLVDFPDRLNYCLNVLDQLVLTTVEQG